MFSLLDVLLGQNLLYFPLKIILLDHFLSHLERIQFQVRKLFIVSLVFKLH